MSETPTFGRYAEIPYEKMSPEQQEGYKSMIEARGRLPGPTKIWVHNPKLAKVAGPFGAHFQPGRYSLSEREREIAVCVITSHWRSAYPTAAHERLAKAAGLPPAKVEAILGGMPAAFDDEFAAGICRNAPGRSDDLDAMSPRCISSYMVFA